MSGEHLPIACSLSDAELRQREQKLLAQFRAAVPAIEELPEGYAFTLAGDEKSMTLAAALMAAERACCPFLTFELLARPNNEPVILRVTGPDNAKEFVKTIFVSGRETFIKQ